MQNFQHGFKGSALHQRASGEIRKQGQLSYIKVHVADPLTWYIIRSFREYLCSLHMTSLIQLVKQRINYLILYMAMSVQGLQCRGDVFH